MTETRPNRCVILSQENFFLVFLKLKTKTGIEFGISIRHWVNGCLIAAEGSEVANT